jgi:N-acetylmuramoyl-L-alanine amidase
MTVLIYLVKTIVISGLLCGYYALFLRNRPYHRFNRLYLISIPVFSLLLPLFHINLPGFWNYTSVGSPIRLLGVGQGHLEEAVTIYANRNAVNILPWQLIAALITLGMSGYLFVRFVQTIRYLLNLRKHKITVKLPEATIYFVSEKGTPFSFFKSIFWGQETEIKSRAGNQILRHELFHVRNKHSREIVGMEIFSMLFWFNPFVYLIIRELKLTHEYEADAYAAAETNAFEYASLLIIKISGTPLPLTNPFFKNQIKRRIAMITKSNKNKKAILGRLMVLPIIALMICLFSFKINGRLQLDTHLPFTAAKTIRVVIDPGHGGVFTGSASNGIYEKNINLSIAKKIQSFSGAYNVEVIMTREKDEDVAGTDLQASLDYRAGLATTKNADLFISIHMNATEKNLPQNKYSGFEIYVSKSDNKFYKGSVKLASVITENIKPDYTIAPELKQRSERIRVLDNATVPAILIECGYMDNQSDLAYLVDEKNQEKIARDILEGIRKYGEQRNNDTSNVSVTTNAGAKANDYNKLDVNENISDSSGPFKKVEVESYYPGESEGWQKYLFKNLKYPEAAISKEVQGEVIVQFIVNTDGTLSGIHAISGPKELRAESVRVVKESGKWIPAMNNKVKVASYRKQPIIYKLA